jgi:hypothetical protein
MDKTILVESDREEGERLLRELDLAGIPVPGAMWYFNPFSEAWRYIVSTPLADTDGPAAVYRKIQTIRSNSVPPISIPIDSIGVVGEKDELVMDFRVFAGTPGKPYVGGTSLQKSAIGDVFVEDSYVYRMEKIPGWTGTVDMEFALPAGDGKVRWERRPGKMTTKEGFITQVEIENFTPRGSTSRNGVNNNLYVFQNVSERDGRKTADISRMRILDGRLRSMEVVAIGVDYPAPTS